MRTPSHAVLAGIAALALIGGASVASAQQPSQNSSGKPESTQTQAKQPQAKQPQAKQPMKMNQAPAADQRMGKNTTEQKPRQQSAKMNETNKATAGNKQAARTKHGRQSAMARSKKTMGRKTAARDHRSRMGRKSRTAEMRSRNHGQRTATQERNGERMATQQRQSTQQGKGMQGLEGNASGMNVQLSDQQRTHIRDTVIDSHGAPRAANVNFDVTVGTMVPRDSIRVVPVPETLVRIEPRWRGLRYFVYENEVVIVNPRDMRIVAVVRV